MKRMLRILLLAVLMVPIGAKVNAQCSGTMCSVTIQMMDGYGDGWYDYDSEPFYVKVYQGTTLRGQATLGNGASGTQTIAVCSSDSVRFVFDGEDSYEESSFTILNGDGTTIIASASCSDYISGQTITTAEVVCPSCIAPFNLSVDASDAENVVVSWIGSASGYEVVVLPATAAFDSSVAVSVTDTVVALDTLTSGTAYSVWVRTDCGSEYSTWAGPVSFAPGLYTMTANSSDTLHACGITIVDDGGLGGDYAPNQNTTLYLYPSDATQMLVLSGSSHSESTYDYVTIYSGIGTSGEVLFTDNGIDVLTTIDTIYSESPVTIVFISDYSNQYDGFQINVSCIDAPDCRRVENFACVNSMTTAHTATFTWQSDASSFQIEYKKAEDTTWTDETANDTAYTLTGLDATTTYNVRVKALCGSDESLYSAVLNVTTTVACPAPTGLRAVLTPGDGTVATLTWSDPTGSAWQICLNGDTNNYIDVTDTAYEMTDLTPEQAITAKVRRDCSEEEEGYSEWTATITFTPTDAYTITVNDGTNTNNYVPIYGYYVDNHIHTQFIVPAADLSAMAFGIVNKLTFYASNASVNWGSASFEVYLTETDATGVNSLNSVADMEEVYSGSLGISGNQMVVTFTTPYQYMGGNLLVAFEQPTSGSYVSCTWYGVSATGASMGGYGSSSVYQQNFLPKMTIDYTPGEEPSCLPVSGLAVSGITGHAATLTWSGDAGSYNVYTISNGDTTSYATVSDTTVDLTGLSGETQYTFGVRAACGSDESTIRIVNFTTLVSCPAPTGLRATLTPGDGTVATLSWHEAGEAAAWQICLNDDMDNLIDVTDTAYEMTDLTPEQAITAKVRAVCGEDDTSAWSSTITFTPTDAFSITVNDGTTTNEYVPVYGWMADNGIKSQFVIPAADLSAIQWGSVTKLTFYASDASASLGSDVFKVYLTETNATGVSSLSPVSDMEEVYSGSLGVSGNKMEITFATPYLYMGGNLLVAFEEPTAGNYARIYWYGVNATGASMGGYENSYGSYIEQRNFLPKMTIDYIPGEEPTCMPVSGLAVSDITGHTAILTWTGEAGSYNVYSISGADTTLVENVSDTTVTLTGLSGETQYTFGVRAACGSDESTIRIVNFTTLVSCPAPTGLRATLTPGDGTVATLSWHEAGEAAAWQICLNDDMDNLIDVTDTAYEMTDLTPEQAITAKVRAVCGEDDTSAWSSTITFTPTDAFSITVNDGTTTNEYVPVYGWMADNGIKSQFVIPAADLSAIQWGSVTKLTFYASDASASLGSDVFKVYLTETNATGVSSLSPVSDMEEVYSGSLGVSGNKMEITFATPYLYMGGNLLVAFEEPTAGNYARIYWYGVNATGASMGGYENSYGSYIEQRDFLPKMTIDYIPGVEPTCLPVSGLTATGISGDEATLSWVGNASSYNVYAVSAADTTLVQNVTDTTITLTGLSPVSSYTYAVAAVCGSDESMMRYVTFNTACGTVTSFPFVEGFSTMPDCWTLVDADGDGYNWAIPSGYSSIQSASYQSVALTPDNWLITPQLAIPATGSYEVTWTATAQDQNWPSEHYGLFVSTTGSDTGDFTVLQEWTLSTGVFNPVVDLSAYAGQDIYLALRHFNCTDMFRISIDDFTVRAQAGANEVVIIVQQNNPAYGAVQGAGTYTIGDTVTVSATPAANYVFSRWVDEDNVTVSTDNPYTFVAATDLTLKAIFLGANAETYTVTVEVNDTTMGTATGSGTYAAGDMATLTATAYSGYRFVNWTHTSDFGVTVFSTDSIVTITVTGDRVYTANFEADSATQPTQYTVTLSSADATMGTVSPAGATTVDEGASFTATATANDGYHFVSWTDAAGAVVSTANPYTFTVTADVTLTATFEANSTPTYYTVTVSSANTTMGTVSCTPSGSVEAGTSVTATATPANNHIFTGWVDANGDTVSRANPYTFTVTADVTLVGTFRYDGVGIDEAEVSNVSLFPNPATSTFTVSATGMKEATVIDLNGRTVMTQSAADGTATFDVSTLAKGTYFVRIVGEQATAVRKLVVK